MNKKLLIVESPGKIKTLEKILGPEYIVKASYGHIRQLDKKTLGIDIAEGLKSPRMLEVCPYFPTTQIHGENGYEFYFQAHFPGQPVMPGVIIVEAFGQAAAALTAYSLNPKDVEDKLVYLMSVDRARFRNPIVPDCKLFLEIEAIRSRGRVWRYQGVAKVNEIKLAEAVWAATIMDRN